ncbi:DUF2794 domain-containing protein [Rhizobium sp. KVB221]|uniref:DUF2794 domain-containing protein n=1 Tax=Rhizobium setariae TaxID=2801340 RepID=A0A936YTP6_9HYPH|nr:DUF2794 domain-containing protein [Rhizobium setariae]MBL0374756.1 DUF2794 domain-containing protein [Rhizobium setariae]
MTDSTEQTGSSSRKGQVVIDLKEYRDARDPMPTTFHRLELNQILRIYGRMVGEGEWRDYAIDFYKDRAVFSVFKRSGDLPLYQVEKNPKLAAKQGAFSILNTQGKILKRGHELAQVLKFFDKVHFLKD